MLFVYNHCGTVVPGLVDRNGDWYSEGDKGKKVGNRTKGAAAEQKWVNSRDLFEIKEKKTGIKFQVIHYNTNNSTDSSTGSTTDYPTSSGMDSENVFTSCDSLYDSDVFNLADGSLWNR